MQMKPYAKILTMKGRTTRRVTKHSMSVSPEKDLGLYGHTDSCPKCDDMIKGNQKSFRQHSNECCLRMYFAWQENEDVKFKRVRNLLEPNAVPDPPGHVVLGGEAAEVHPASPAPSPVPMPTPVAADMEDEEDHSGRWDPAFQETDDAVAMDEYFQNPQYSPPGSEPDMDVADENAMVKDLVLSGVYRKRAKKRVEAMTSSRPMATLTEVYGRGRIVDCANHARRDLNVLGMGAFDMRTSKPDGTPWDFSRRANRRLARSIIDRDDPEWIIGRPPCTAFAIWNYAMNYPKMDPDRVRRAIHEGRIRLNVVLSLYRRQIRRGKYVLHEHPATALSWKDDKVLNLLKHPEVIAVVCDQCQYGLTAPVPGSNDRLPALKPTRFMTNSKEMASLLSLRCDRSHQHQPLVGGRCEEAAFYPLPLVKAVLKGIRATAEADQLRARLMEKAREYIHAVTDSAGTIPTTTESLPRPPTSSIQRVTGGVLPIQYHPQNFKPRYVDEYTGEVLDPLLVQAAIMEELNYLNDVVWDVETKTSMTAVLDHIFVRSRWVLCNKGDADSPDIRARLVACELNKEGKQDSFFASTPPLEAKKSLSAQYARERHRGGAPLQLSFVDFRKPISMACRNALCTWLSPRSWGFLRIWWRS